jgi:hypothetical protein
MNKKQKQTTLIITEKITKNIINFISLILYLCLVMGFFMGTIFSIKFAVELDNGLVYLSVIANFVGILSSSYNFVKLSNKM